MQLPIPDDWDGESTCRWAICWPDSPKWRAILSGLVEMPAQGRLWDFSTGHFLTLRQQFRPIYDYNFTLKECIMACGDTGITDLADSIRYFADKYASAQVQQANTIIASANACCEQTMINSGGGTVGSFPQDGIDLPIYGSQPPIGIPSGEYPEGYDSEEEYLTDKCAMAYLVVSGLIQTLRSLGALGVFNGVALAGLIVASIAGAIIFPPSAIPIAAALIGILSVGVTILDQVADAIEENKEGWACAIYNSVDVETALGLLADLIDAVIAALNTTGAIGLAVKQLVLLLMNSDTLNQAFAKTAHLEYPDADCSGCGCVDETQPFDSSSYPFEPYLTAGKGTSTWENGRLRATRTAPFEASTFVGWKWEISGYVVTAGDKIYFDTYGIQGESHGHYMQLNFTDQTIAYWGFYDNIDHIGANLFLDEWVGKEIDYIWLYVEGDGGVIREWDNFRIVFCGENAPTLFE